MQCHTHPDVGAVATCSGCAESFCGNCLVSIGGAYYCGQCKSLAVNPTATPILRDCKEAGEALKYALIGIFCFGIFLEPIAIVKAVQARKLIADDPSLGGKAKATTAIIIACVVMFLWVIGIAARVSNVKY